MARLGRSKKKSRVERKQKPMSRFVKGSIDGETYFKQTGQRVQK